MDRNRIKEILEQVKDGSLSPEKAAKLFEDIQIDDLGFANIDHHRCVRIGFPEIVYGEGKTPAQIIGIVESLKKRQSAILVTRVDQEKAKLILESLDYLDYNPTANTLLFSQGELERQDGGSVMVVAAGTSDMPCAEEAAVTATALGARVDTLYDVGIAGIHRLLNHIDRLRAADVVIAVAGMEGALPSVVGGLVDGPVIAVPTSVGYGAAFGGIAALLGMLNSCAPGVVVVNIDNGFGAAYAATIIAGRKKRSGPPAGETT
jgi:hypothetical protein